MTASEFRDWARSEDLELNASLEQLNDTVVAIDAEEYLQRLLSATGTREPLLPAIGGRPFSLQKNVERDLQAFKDAKITPFFVFNGLEVAAKDRSMIDRESRKASRILNEAWSVYEQGKAEDAVNQFGRACLYRIDQIIRWLKAFLHKKNATVQTALYTAAAQIAYLLNSDIVDAAYGGADCLLFDASQVITHIDWESQSFSWVELQPCLDKLFLKKEAFTDLMLLSGLSILPPLADIDADSVTSRVLSARNLLGTANQDGHVACLNVKDEVYADALWKARFTFQHPILLQKDGSIVVKNQDSAPNDVHAFIGQRLPDEVYYYLSRGILGPRVLEWRTRNEAHETQPLEGGGAQPYRDFLQDKLHPLRSQSLALLTRLLHRYYQRTDVEFVGWWRDDDRKTLNIPDLIEDASANADSWHVVAQNLPSSSSADIFSKPIAFAVESLADGGSAKKTLTPRSDDKPGILTEPRELVANTTWRFLHDRGYINPDHTLSAWGKALHESLEHARKSGQLTDAFDNAVEESILVAFELLRMDMLSGKTLFQAPLDAGAPIRGSDVDKGHTLLISRVASLGAFRHETIGYTGPLSRNLLAFHQITVALRNSLRDLFEAHACNLLLSASVTRQITPQTLSDLGASLPFSIEPDLGLALVVRSYLDELSSTASSRADIKPWFKHVLDVPADLRRAWALWEAVNTGVQGADGSIVTNETRKLFKSADEWLHNKLDSVKESTS